MRHKRIIRRAATVLLVALFLGGFADGWWFRLRTIRVEIGLKQPVRLAVMSDLHLGSYGSQAMVRRAVAEAMRRRPDMVVLVGDLVSGAGAISMIPRALAGLRAPLGVYAVLGNHDHWASAGKVRAALAREGVRVLTNRSVIVGKGRALLALVGIDDLWAGRVDWRAAWRGAPRGVPAVLLSHNPDAAIRPQGQRARLILCGHTHAGKFRLPVVLHRLLAERVRGGLIPHSEYGRTHIYGLFHERWGWVYVTSGAGAGLGPPRWWTRPEGAIVELS
jgi:hypothetical protein